MSVTIRQIKLCVANDFWKVKYFCSTNLLAYMIGEIVMLFMVFLETIRMLMREYGINHSVHQKKRISYKH